MEVDLAYTVSLGLYPFVGRNFLAKVMPCGVYFHGGGSWGGQDLRTWVLKLQSVVVYFNHRSHGVVVITSRLHSL
jgi:hypothetical protein